MIGYRMILVLLCVEAVGGAVAPVWASDRGQFTADEENDKFGSHDDRHFTQGLEFSYLSGDIAPQSTWDQPFQWLGDHTPLFQDGTKRKIETSLGQSLFTPADLTRGTPDPHDRPYAGWLYVGSSLLQDHDGRGLENLELLVGVVGPSAFGKQTQNDFHQLIKVGEAHGWGHQLQDEPGLVLSYERKWRFSQPLWNTLGIDVIPEAGASLGNVLTYGEMGGLVRVGQNLAADYGASHIRPSLSGTSWFDADRLDGDFGWNLFVGTQGRAVGRNIFLDGNTFRDSASVEKRPLVADFVLGAEAFWSDSVRLGFTLTDRTKEYYGQPSRDHFGMITLTLGL
jgi:hypothetical protein